MTKSSEASKSIEDHMKQLELEDALKAGLAPAPVEEDFEDITNYITRHIPPYKGKRPVLKPDRKWKPSPYSKPWYGGMAERLRRGACENCGAFTHSLRFCMERPRRIGAKWLNNPIFLELKIEGFTLNCDGKFERWNGFDAEKYAKQLKQLEEKNSKQNKEDGLESDDSEDALKVDQAKVDESKQMDFAMVEKLVPATGGVSTEMVRDLHNRVETAKFIYNMHVNSTYNDPQTLGLCLCLKIIFLTWFQMIGSSMMEIIKVD